MKTIAVWILAGVNAALLGIFAFQMNKPTPAVAQQARQGDYLMIPGEVLGGNNAVVYVVDQTNHLLSAMSYDDANRALQTMTPRNLDHDFDQIPTPGARKGH